MVISNTEIWSVVPAAGIGRRMQSELPKQYLPLLGGTVMDISLSKVLGAVPLAGVMVALNPQDTWWQDSRFHSHSQVFTCEGGKERSESVLNALLEIASLSSAASLQQCWVLVHDAVRPCVDMLRIGALVTHCIDKNTGGILAAPVADTLKRLNTDKRIVDTLDRQHIWQAHTPQFFPYTPLRQALEYCSLKQLPVTDEASALEHQGREVCVCADRRDNIKITVPEDLPWAQHILQQQKFNMESVCV